MPAAKPAALLPMDIRTLKETPAELSAFVTRIWRSDYAGRMVIPLWSPEYLDWQLQMSTGDRRHLLAAYEGERLIGTLLGVPCPLLVNGERRTGLISSWLTIEPDARGAGLVPALKAEQVRRLEDDGGELILSYRYHGTRDSLADRPQPGADDDDTMDARWVGLWVRLLDARRAADWYLFPTDRLLTRFGSPFLRKLQHRSRTITVRDATEDDLEACLQILREAASSTTLAIAWDNDSLRHHLLGGTVNRGLVACRGEQVVGLLAYHLLPYLGREVADLAIIDLLQVDGMGHFERTAFLKAGLARMRDDGAILAVKMGLGDLPVAAMIDSSFIPRGRDSLQVLRWLKPQARTLLRGRQLVLWR